MLLILLSSVLTETKRDGIVGSLYEENDLNNSRLHYML